MDIEFCVVVISVAVPDYLKYAERAGLYSRFFYLTFVVALCIV